MGYIIQFVGLRALHWSATIAQLGITLIMTAIRAWVRRGLASDPDWYPLVEGHELASLALVMRYRQGNIANASRLSKHFDMAREPLYELTFLYRLLSDHLSPVQLHLFDNPPQTSLDFEDSGEYEEHAAPLRIYSRISEGIPLSGIDKEASTLSTMFFTVIRNVMDVLDLSGALIWKGEASGQPSEQVVTDLISWVFDFSTTKPPFSDNRAQQKVSFRLQRSTDHAKHQWTLLNHDRIAAFLVLSAQALARRLEHVHEIRGGEKLSIGDQLFFVHSEVPFHPSSSGRIVGNIMNDDSSSNEEILEEWLDAEIRSPDFFLQSYNGLHCYLGIFLASSPKYV